MDAKNIVESFGGDSVHFAIQDAYDQYSTERRRIFNRTSPDIFDSEVLEGVVSHQLGGKRSCPQRNQT